MKNKDDRSYIAQDVPHIIGAGIVIILMGILMVYTGLYLYDCLWAGTQTFSWFNMLIIWLTGNALDTRLLRLEQSAKRKVESE